MAEQTDIPYAPEYRTETIEPKKSGIRKRSGSTPKQIQKRKGTPPRELFFKLTVVAFIIMLIFAPLAGYIGALKSEEEPVPMPESIENHVLRLQAELEHETYYAAVEVLTSEAAPDLELVELEDRIRSKLDFIIQTEIEPTFIEIETYNFELNDIDVALEIKPLYTKSYDEITGIPEIAGCNDFLDNMKSPMVVPGYYEVEVTLNLIANSLNDNSEIHNQEMAYQVVIRDIYPFLEYGTDLFQFDASTPSGRIQRTVSYMLTTLVRHRLKLEYGYGSAESPLNVLNEGDVELAVNLAVLFEELSLLKEYDVNALQAVDKYYRSAHDPDEHAEEPNWSPSNPTGQRYWGSAELDNFNKLYNYVKSSGTERSLEQLLDSVQAEAELLDPADIIALYMILDRDLPGITIDPTDENALMDDLHLWDPRTTYDITDANDVSLRYKLSEDDFFSFNEDLTETWSEISEEITVDHEPKYLIVGKDIFVNGLTKPRGWYTDIQLTKTRTPGPPPDTPSLDQHDFRVQWDLNIYGEFDLNLGSLWQQSDTSGPSAYFTHDTWCNRTIKLDFPVTIYGWLTTIPQNNIISFYSLNPQQYDYPNDTWVQWPSAQLKEFFSAKLWSNLKPYVNLCMEKQNAELEFTRNNYATRINLLESAVDLNARDEFYSNEFENLLTSTDSSFWTDLTLFSQFYLQNYTQMKDLMGDAQPPLWMLEDGFNITIGYSDDLRDLTFIFHHQTGTFKFNFGGVPDTGLPEEFLIEGEVKYQYGPAMNEQTDYHYTFSLPMDNWDMPVFSGRYASDIQVSYSMGSEITSPDMNEPRYGFDQPGNLIEHSLPTFSSSNGVEQDLTIKLGLYRGSESVVEFDANVNELSQSFIDAYDQVAKSSDSTITEPELRGYFTALTENFGENNYLPNANKIMISFNSSFISTEGKHQYRECGFYIETPAVIMEFLSWLSINNHDLISSLMILPQSSAAVQKMVTTTGIGLDDEIVDNIRFYFIYSTERTYLITGKLSALNYCFDPKYNINSKVINYVVEVSQIYSMPEYAEDSVNGNSRILYFAEEPIIGRIVKLII